jgi:IS5 family transposase
MQQSTFASVAWEKKGKITRRERFLAEMDAVIPWARLLGLIEPHYPKAGNGTQPKPLEQMLRIYFMQNWFNLSDPQAEDSLYDIESMRRFAGIELLGHDIPDESTILRFRHLLEAHQLTERIFAEIRTLLEEKRLLLKSGTIVDATIIAAPPSTKNEQGARDPEMRQTKKGKDWHFGMKAHIGTDRHGIVHSMSTTAANVHDSTQMSKLLHGQEREVFGDQAYWNESHRQSAAARGIRYRINRVEHASEVYQPPPLGCSGARRARLPRGQTSVGLHQGALPRLGQEHRAAVYRLCTGELVSAQTTPVATTGKVSLVNAMSDKSSKKTTLSGRRIHTAVLL